MNCLPRGGSPNNQAMSGPKHHGLYHEMVRTRGEVMIGKTMLPIWQKYG
jgi:hypothetical protein